MNARQLLIEQLKEIRWSNCDPTIGANINTQLYALGVGVDQSDKELLSTLVKAFPARNNLTLLEMAIEYQLQHFANKP